MLVLDAREYEQYNYLKLLIIMFSHLKEPRLIFYSYKNALVLMFLQWNQKVTAPTNQFVDSIAHKPFFIIQRP